MGCGGPTREPSKSGTMSSDGFSDQFLSSLEAGDEPSDQWFVKQDGNELSDMPWLNYRSRSLSTSSSSSSLSSVGSLRYDLQIGLLATPFPSTPFQAQSLQVTRFPFYRSTSSSSSSFSDSSSSLLSC